MPAPLAIGAAAILRAAAATQGRTIGAGLAGVMGEIFEGLAVKADDIDVTVPVSSEAIAAIGYHSAGIITVEFHRGGSKHYEYPGTEEMFMAFLAAPSKGEFFNAHFR